MSTLGDAADAADHAAPDAATIARLIAGDVLALRQAFAEHGAHLTTVAIILTGSPDLAAEAVQDAFIQLWNARATLGPVRHLRGYLTTMTSRRARDIWRHEQMHARIARTLTDHLVADRASVAYNEGSQAIESEELEARVAAAIDALPARCSEVFRLRHEAHLTYPEIAAALELSEMAVRKHISRAMHAVVAAVTAWRNGN